MSRITAYILCLPFTWLGLGACASTQSHVSSQIEASSVRSYTHYDYSVLSIDHYEIKIEDIVHFENTGIHYEFEDTNPMDSILPIDAPLYANQAFSCGLIVKEEPQALFTLQHIGSQEKWIPINGQPKRVNYFRLIDLEKQE